MRAFKLDCREDLCENYGQVTIYKGTIPEWPHSFDLDDHLGLLTDKPMLVCGNTAATLQQTRSGAHFAIQRVRSVHFDPFNRLLAAARVAANAGVGASCC